MLWIHLEEWSSWNGARFSNNANQPEWAGAGGPNLVYKEDAWEGMGGLLRGKQVALVSWVGALLSWGGEQQQLKCWLTGKVSGSAFLCCWAQLQQSASLCLNTLCCWACSWRATEPGRKVIHSELHFSSNTVKWSGCRILGLQAFRSFGWN